MTLTVTLTIASVVVLFSGTGSQPVTASPGVFLGNGCNGCHLLNDLPGNAQVGPDLTHVDDVASSRVDGLSADEYIRQSLREPQAFVVPGYRSAMPTFTLSEDDIEALIALLLAADET